FALKNRASEGERRMIDAFSAFLLDGEHEQAAAIFRELTQEYPGDPHIPAHLGLRYVHALERYEEAVENFKLAVERDPDWAPTRNWLGYALLKAGRVGEAEEVFQDNLERHPKDHFTHNFIGEVFLTAGRSDEAEALFERALELDPTFNAARINLARVGVETGKSRLEQALVGHVPDAGADVLTKDVQFLSGGEEIIQGRDVVRQRWDDIFPSPVSRADLETVEVFAGMDGDTATEFGRYDLGGEEGTSHVGRYAAVWQKTDEGWKLHRVLWTKL
ncbi:MAG: tetratricopeptide repeat protein, partial [Anaerolineales bacterium]|nr:tetratricopeptide repeat protein [Anaerolineales bacterium]